jgi:hypothetical protein
MRPLHAVNPAKHELQRTRYREADAGLLAALEPRPKGGMSAQRSDESLLPPDQVRRVRTIYARVNSEQISIRADATSFYTEYRAEYLAQLVAPMAW